MTRGSAHTLPMCPLGGSQPAWHPQHTCSGGEVLVKGTLETGSQEQLLASPGAYPGERRAQRVEEASEGREAQGEFCHLSVGLEKSPNSRLPYSLV